MGSVRATHRSRAARGVGIGVARVAGLERALPIGLSTDQSQTDRVARVEGRLQQVVGENLRRVRRRLGYSQESFGEHVGWHRTFVGAVERGERNLTLRTVERISEQLNVDPLDLLWDREAITIQADAAGVVTTIGPTASKLVAADAEAAAGATAARRGPKRSRPTPG